jgi:hypothetical protein
MLGSLSQGGFLDSALVDKASQDEKEAVGEGCGKRNGCRRHPGRWNVRSPNLTRIASMRG